MFLQLYGIAFAVFLALDLLWLGIVARRWYAEHLGFLLRPDVNWVAALAFYLLFVAGLVVFVVQPALAHSSWQRVLVLGAFFGLVTYATYDLTNLATIKNWPLLLTLVDLLWGSILSAAVAAITLVLARKLGI